MLNRERNEPCKGYTLQQKMNVPQTPAPVILQVWEPVGERRRRLRLAPRFVARSRAGEPILDFDAEYRRWLGEAARLAPKEKPAAYASRTAGADPRTVREDTPVVEVVRIGGIFLTTCSDYLVRNTPVDVSTSFDEACERAAERAESVLRAFAAQRAFIAPNRGAALFASLRTRRTSMFGVLLVLAGFALITARLPIAGGVLIGAGAVLVVGGFG